MPIRIAVCDSDREVARDIKNLIEGENIAATVKLFSSAEELLASHPWLSADSNPAHPAPEPALSHPWLSTEETFFHIYFLDIKGIDGVKLAQEIRLREEHQGREKSIIIFVTGFSEYVEDAFDIRAFHYLLKPVNKEKFRWVLYQSLKEIEILRQNEKYILVSISTSQIAPSSRRKILLKDILYIESNNKNVMLHLNNEILYVQGTMKEFENICGVNFYRCHRCYLVNFAKIAAYSQNEITMEGGDKIMLAYKKHTAFVKAYLSYAKGGGIVNV